MVVRIMLMVPIYAISSFISLFSLEAAFFIDVVRDIYEAFVIYCFFDLLIAYLGGERSLLILLHGRPPKYPIFPTSIFWREVDVSDPHTFLFLKRGVIQYVQVKPMLALVTVILKLLGKFNEGDLRANSGYLYVSLVYNASICLSLYCLAIFWMCVNNDLKPFRPMPKFLCVKGILFFSFWQSIFISILVAAGAITKLGPYTDNEHISLGLTDSLICFEMPLFAIAHMYAFATRDFVDPQTMYVARMPVYYAFRDAFGLKDVVEDTKATLRGEHMDYREFEPSEGYIHQGAGRDRRIRAGLRYSQGGRRKYWLPQHTTSTRPPGSVERHVNRVVGTVVGQDEAEEVYAPLLSGQAENVVHTAADLRSLPDEGFGLFSAAHDTGDGYDLEFGDLDDADEELFEHSKKYLFGDYHYPSVDVSSEVARKTMWEEEERILRDERGAYFSPVLGPGRVLGRSGNYGATGNFHRSTPRERHDSDLSDGARRRGKLRGDVAPPPIEVVINKEDDRLPAPDMGEVRLRWTSGKEHVLPSPRVRTLSASAQPALALSGSASPSSSSGSPMMRPPPSPRTEIERPALPPDAVDLVVEDHHAAQDEMVYERRKGEPAVRGGAGLRKVYRRGYVVDDGEARAEGDGGVEDESGDQDAMFTVGDDVDNILDAEAEVIDETTTITTLETPPAHAHIVYISPTIPDNENPWA
ncbi:organic solute transporter Ostalpha-domain-containing protein [Sparassis latifolia]